MPVDVTVATTIARPPEVVSEFAGDPTNTTRWYANIRSATWQTPPPVAVGSRVRFEAHFLGRELAYTYEVVELVPGERLVMRTTQGPFPMETTYTWAPADGGTEMRLRNLGGSGGLLDLASPLVTRAVRLATAKDLARLKSLLESGG